ncbi:PTS transporter subunit EIIC [Levilactobacillus sp. HBUAS70063]|uniref:PTS transporter subunit EIIC n=1 Tax=Levilactobacillus sp. HBUAS70063 TaxID=3109359 RepID=UPI003132E944
MVGQLRGLWRLNQRVNQWRAMRAVREALRVAYPFILVMALTDVIGQGCLSKSGFFFQIYHIGSWLPGITLWRQALQAVSVVVNGLVAVMIAFTTGHYLARTYHTEPLAVGMMSALAFLTLNVNYSALGQNGPTGSSFLEANLGPQGIFLSILVGLGVGWLASHVMQGLAKWWLRRHQVALSWTSRIAWSLIVVLSLTVAIGYGLSWIGGGGINNLVYLSLQTLNTNLGHDGLRILTMTAISNGLWWLGLIGPIDVAGNSSVTSLQNLAYAVQHGSGWDAPHPVTLHTLGDAYANFGGAGMTLALIIAIWIGSRQASYRRVANQTVIPNLLNLNEPTLLGLPVLFNPVLLVPFVMAPAVNIVLAWAAISWKLVPPIVYPVPRTTPGPLVAYLGTGGDWRALLLSLLCLGVSVVIYLPFVRLLNDAGGVDHAA